MECGEGGMGPARRRMEIADEGMEEAWRRTEGWKLGIEGWRRKEGSRDGEGRLDGDEGRRYGASVEKEGRMESRNGVNLEKEGWRAGTV